MISKLRRNSPFSPWNLYAPGRSLRPLPEMGEVFAHDAVESCPFEPNHADSSERERLVFRDHLDQWYLKILDNKYPFLGDRRVPVFDAYGPWNEMDAVGNHEIIIDTPDHYLVLHEFDVFGISEILRAAGERYLARKVDRSNFFFYLFRNNGRHAGASISHSHWQLFFSNFIPSGFEEMHHEYEQYKKWTNGGCLKCAQSAEVQKGVGQESSLLVSMNGHCTAFVPFAPEYPYEIWIVPDVCSPCFAYDIKNPYLRNDIAHMLREVLKRFAAVVGKPSLMQYNIMLYTGLMLQDTNPSWHWYLRFTPRCFEIGGACEHGIKMFIVPGMPEMYAQTLREIM